jgi:dsRNA-specific ribonuclease
MADYVSLLHLYCQKAGLVHPVWTINQAEGKEHEEFSAYNYIYKCTLEIDELKFYGNFEKSKNEAKKSVASQAWNYFKSKGNPFFTDSCKEKLINYTNQLNQLCTSMFFQIYF